MCFSDSDHPFDTLLDYTQTIFMKVQHFCACITTMHTACKPQFRVEHQQQQSNPEEAAPFQYFIGVGTH